MSNEIDLRKVRKVNANNFDDFDIVIPFALSSIVEVSNVEGYNSIGFHLKPPTGGKVVFEGSFDGINFTPITVRELSSNGYVQASSIEEDYIGSVSALRSIRLKVVTAGTANGAIAGRITDNVSTIEGIEQGSAPHNFGYEIKKVSFEFLIPQTNAIILTPTSGKRWVITDLITSVDGINDIVFFDETNIVVNHIIKIRTGNERIFNHPFRGVVKSAAINNILRVTSTNQADFRGTIIYYEIE